MRASDRAIAKGVGGESWRETRNNRIRCWRNVARRGRHDAVGKSDMNKEIVGGAAKSPVDAKMGSGMAINQVVADIDDRVVDPAHTSAAAAVPVVADDIAGR